MKIVDAVIDTEGKPLPYYALLPLEEGIRISVAADNDYKRMRTIELAKKSGMKNTVKYFRVHSPGATMFEDEDLVAAALEILDI